MAEEYFYALEEGRHNQDKHQQQPVYSFSAIGNTNKQNRYFLKGRERGEFKIWRGF